MSGSGGGQTSDKDAKEYDSHEANMTTAKGNEVYADKDNVLHDRGQSPDVKFDTTRTDGLREAHGRDGSVIVERTHDKPADVKANASDGRTGKPVHVDDRGTVTKPTRESPNDRARNSPGDRRSDPKETGHREPAQRQTQERKDKTEKAAQEHKGAEQEKRQEPSKEPAREKAVR